MQAVPDILISQLIQVSHLRAIEMEADCILLAKAIDGVYDSDPKVNPEAKKFDTISIQEVIDTPVSSCRSDRIYHVHGTQDANGCIQLK